MWELISIVTPKVKAHWRDLAYSMGYSICDVKALETDGNDSHEKCIKLFENWLTGQSCSTAKTWKMLLERIKAVNALKAAAKEIENELSTKQ